MYAPYAAWQATYGEVQRGDVLQQPALARTIELLAHEGPDAFYRGPIADAIASAVQELGGDLAATDLAAHAGEWVDPLRSSYRGVEVAELPPPTQGVSALEALRILDSLELPSDGVERLHLMIEATKLALSDRDRWVSDPTTMPRPADDLLSDGWIKARASEVDPAHAGTPSGVDPQPGGTAYLCAADADGLFRLARVVAHRMQLRVQAAFW